MCVKKIAVFKGFGDCPVGFFIVAAAGLKKVKNLLFNALVDLVFAFFGEGLHPVSYQRVIFAAKVEKQTLKV